MFVNMIDGEGLIHSKNEEVNGKTLEGGEGIQSHFRKDGKRKKHFTLKVVNDNQERRDIFNLVICTAAPGGLD